MGDLVPALIQELQQEAQATRKLLSAIPNDKLSWKPHEKSMTLGQLAMHIAGLPANLSRIASGEGMDVKNARSFPPQPESSEEILKTFESSIGSAANTLQQWDEAQASGIWRFTNGEKEVFALPRTAVIRRMLLNHLYHHRGQLTVYLRLLDVLLPVTYGRSADTNPFG
jgi:uncharacterized damage-inducible protein DinB